MTHKATYLRLLKFVLPLGLWLFLFRYYLTGKAVIFSENFMLYTMVKFFLDNLRTGVFPLWNPLILWGTVNSFSPNHFGPYNPVWFLVLLLNMAGMKLYFAYITGLILYLFIGLVGFYRLAKVLLKNTAAAAAAFLLLAFSSLTFPMFANFLMLLIFIPGIWFFYFLVRFHETGRRLFFLGMAYALMLILSTYLPFYFLTVFLAAALFAAVLSPGTLGRFGIRTGKFIAGHKVLTALCLAVLLTAAVPALISFHYTRTHEIVAPDRQGGDEAEILQNGLVLDKYFSIGGLSGRMEGEDLFSHLDQIVYANDGFFYVSLFAFLVLALGAFNKINRRIVFLVLLTFFLFLMSIANASPVHRFLYEHVGYFRLFRNAHYFLPYLLACVALLAGEHLRLILEAPRNWAGDRRVTIGLVVMVHAGFLFFLTRLEAVIVTSYVALGLSFLFFTLVAALPPERRNILCACLLPAAVLVQPAEVFWHHNRQAPLASSPIIRAAIEVPAIRPVFSFVRPDVPPLIPRIDEREQRMDYIRSRRAAMKDAPGFILKTFSYPTRWSLQLAYHYPADLFRRYTKHKFFVFDRIAWLDDRDPALDQKMTGLFTSLSNPAYVALPPEEKGKAPLEEFVRPARPVTERPVAVDRPGLALAVGHFDVNSLRLTMNYPEPKFLVYNDSYLSPWKAFVDGKETAVYRANIAFKGVPVPAGPHEVAFRFRPWGGQVPGVLGLLVCGMIFPLIIVREALRKAPAQKTGDVL